MSPLLLILVLLASISKVSSFRVPFRQRFGSGVRPLQADLSSVIIDPNYNLALGSLSLGLAGVLADNVVQAKPFPDPSKILTSILEKVGILLVAFGLFFGYQTTTLRFAFDANSNFKLMKADGESVGENIVVGGENSWASSSFVNYDFLPSRSFPILVYFKEVQTPKEAWIEAPILVDDLKEGQVHFFPAIANVAQLEQEFQAHNCKQISTAGRAEVAFKSTPKLVL